MSFIFYKYFQFLNRNPYTNPYNVKYKIKKFYPSTIGMMVNIGWEFYFIVFIICINLYVLFYIYSWNENVVCPCAVNSKLTYIRYYLVFSIVAGIAEICYMLLKPRTYKKYSYMFFLMFIPFNIIYSYLTYIYTQELRNKTCTCIKPLYIHIMYYASLLSTFLFSTTGIFFVFLAVSYFTFKRNS